MVNKQILLRIQWYIWIFFLGKHNTLNIFWMHYQRMDKILTIGTVIVPECPGDLGQVPASVWYTSCFVCEE